MKPVRLLRKLAAAAATGLLAVGVFAGAASADSADDHFSADGNAGELSSSDGHVEAPLWSVAGNAGELS